MTKKVISGIECFEKITSVVPECDGSYKVKIACRSMDEKVFIEYKNLSGAKVVWVDFSEIQELLNIPNGLRFFRIECDPFSDLPVYFESGSYLLNKE